MKLYTRSVAVGFFLICWASSAFAQIQFDRPKVEGKLSNPYMINAKREDILRVAREVLKLCAIPINEATSSTNEGKIVTGEVVFTRGVTTRSDLEHLATLPASEVRNWLQGRYILEITAIPVDQSRSQLQVSARIQGRMAGVLEGEKWVDGVSNGTLEDEVLRGLAGKILGIDLSVEGKKQRRILNCEY